MPLKDQGWCSVRGQFVHVENRLPMGLAVAELRDGCAAIPAPRVFLVLPEVIEIAAHLGDLGNARLRIEHRERIAVQSAVIQRGFELAEGSFILFMHPGQRPLPVNVLEPEIGVRRVRQGVSVGVFHRG